MSTNLVMASELIDHNVNQFYEEFDDVTGHWFLCKYQECGELLTTEGDIIEHLKQQHLRSSSEEIPPNMIRIDLANNYNHDYPQDFKPKIECIDLSLSDEEFIKTEPIDDMNGDTNGNLTMTITSVEEEEDNWQKWFDVLEDDKLKCKFSSDCGFECALRFKAKQHLSKHLNELRDGIPTPVIKTGYITKGQDVWNHLMEPTQSTSTTRSHKTQIKSTPKPSTTPKPSARPRGRPRTTPQVTPRPIKSEQRTATKTAPLTEAPESTPSHSLVDVHFNQNDALLSLKGMASVKKLDQYIRCEVANDCKYFCCNYSESCQFKSKRSQETALHVHCTHLNFYLKCVQPGCDRIFRTPGSWREHQKNHICNFGLYGYQKGVTGKCRNEYLKQFQEKIIIEGNQKAYRCLWKDCGFTTKHRTGVKRHIHNNHVCEYRKTKQWRTQLVELMKSNSFMSDIAIPSNRNNNNKQNSGSSYKRLQEQTVYKRLHVCLQCSAQFGTESDLRKHEAICTKWSARNGPNLRSSHKSNDSQYAATNPVNGPQKIANTKKGRRLDGSRQTGPVMTITEVPNVSKNLNGSDIRAKCEHLIEVKLYEGVDYYLCKASNCKFVTKNPDKIYEHIPKMHSLIPSDARVGVIAETPRAKRNLSEGVSDVMSKRPKNSPQKSNHSPRDGVTQLQSAAISGQTSETMSFIDKYREYIDIKSIDSEPNYFCKYLVSDKKCRFYSNIAQEIEEHIRQEHVVFKCDVKDCDREFKTQNLLEIHRRNHICGFGIRGMKASGVCALDNVRKYRREVLVEGRYQYECKSCGYLSDSKTTVLSHIHNRHIHPQPPPDD